MNHDNLMMESVYFIGSGDLLCKGKNIKSKGKKLSCSRAILLLGA